MGISGLTNLGIDPGVSSTTMQFGLGELAFHDGGIYEYVKAGAAVAQYDGVMIDEDGTATLAVYAASPTVPTKIGIAQVAIASGSYGWVLRQGKGRVTCLASCAIDVKLYTSATAGSFDDTSTTQWLIVGLRIDTAVGAGGAANVPCSAATLMYVN
jgi:hypothetical protein